MGREIELTKRIQRALPILLASLVGCGGATPEPSSASDETPASEAPAAESDGSEPRADQDPARAERAEGNAAPASVDDVRTVLQLVIDDEALDPLLHLDQPGRFPLAIAGPNLPDGLVKSTQAVRIVQAPASKKEAVLVFTKIEVDGKHASIAYRYDIEGVRGTASLDKGEHGWTLTRSKVTER